MDKPDFNKLAELYMYGDQAAAKPREELILLLSKMFEAGYERGVAYGWGDVQDDDIEFFKERDIGWHDYDPTENLRLHGDDDI